MSRTRDVRRHFTKRYQRKQLRIHKVHSFGKLKPKHIGRMRKLSYCDCGNPRCGSCASPRNSKVYVGTRYAKLTLQEKRQLDSYKDQLLDL